VPLHLSRPEIGQLQYRMGRLQPAQPIPTEKIKEQRSHWKDHNKRYHSRTRNNCPKTGLWPPA
jgi:hypothetical protein